MAAAETTAASLPLCEDSRASRYVSSYWSGGYRACLTCGRKVHVSRYGRVARHTVTRAYQALQNDTPERIRALTDAALSTVEIDTPDDATETLHHARKGQDTMTDQPETSQPQGWTAAETARRQAEIRRDEEREAAQRSRNAHERSCAGDTDACGRWSLEPNHVEARCIACGAPFCETCATPTPGSADACSYCGQERPVDYIACGYVHAPGDACTAPERIVIVETTMAYTYARSASQAPEAGDTEPHWQRCDVYGSREAAICDHCGASEYGAWYATEDSDTLCSGCVEIVDAYDAASLAPGTPGAVWQSAQTQAAYLSRLSDAATEAR